MPTPPISRRHFVQQTLAAGAGVALAGRAPAAETKPAARFRIVGFSKPFQSAGYERCAEIVKEVGWSGIECPVRKKGQIEPERIDDELPKLHDAFQKEGLAIDLITTDIRGVNPLTQRVLRAAQKLGIKRYRLTFVQYDLDKPIPPQVASWKAELRELAALNKELGLHGGIQNHSGAKYMGAPIWDLYEMLHDLEPKHLGICFDIGHATVEGGLSWPIQARLMEPFFTAVFVKDFFWDKGARGWAPKWGPLGEGQVRKEFFDWLQKSSFSGPLSQHIEYPTGDGPEQVAAMKKDCATLKKWLGAA